MIKKYSNLTNTIYQKYVYDIYDGSFPEEIDNSEYLSTEIKIPYINRRYPDGKLKRFEDWGNIKSEIWQFYVDLVNLYNKETYNLYSFFVLAGVLLEYLFKYEICRRNQSDKALIKYIFYTEKSDLTKIVLVKKKSIVNLFDVLPKLKPLKKEIVSFVELRNAFIHCNLDKRNKAMVYFKKNIGLNSGYFIINGKKTLITHFIGYVGVDKKAKEINETSQKNHFFNRDEAYLTICLIFEIYKKLYESVTYVNCYNLFLRTKRRRLPSKLEFLYYK